MAKNLIISILLVSLASAAAEEIVPAGLQKPRLLVDGLVLTEVDGKLITSNKDEDRGKWFFVFDSELRDGKGIIKRGTSVQLLPSTALEKMTAGVKGKAEANYRLWGRVTKYRDKNFIFPIYFLPLSKSTPLPKQQELPQPAINDPNDTVIIPEEVIARLQTRRIVRPEQLRKGLELEQDSILTDRIGLIQHKEEETSFVFDGIGRNAPKISLHLLPCRTLELAQRQQSAEPDQVRFKIAGIITQYKGRRYLLLQRAMRIYSHQNFGK